MNIEIGGYFGLELNKGITYHPNAIQLNTGRNALEYILKVRNYKKIFIPYYSCDVLLEPLIKTNTKHEFYKIDKDLLPKNIKLAFNEALLIINYFGILDKKIKELSNRFVNVIIDNSHAFFTKSLHKDTFYSCRKFFGVPDGAFLYIDKVLEGEIKRDISYRRMNHLLKRVDSTAEAGYNDFIKNERRLCNQPIKKMSRLTLSLMKSINYHQIRRIRRNNFLAIHKYLCTSNELNFKFSHSSVPMVYPYLVKNGYKLREKLISKKIFTAQYWPSVNKLSNKNSFECYLAKNLIAIPIDQRYTIKEIKYILHLL